MRMLWFRILVLSVLILAGCLSSGERAGPLSPLPSMGSAWTTISIGRTSPAPTCSPRTSRAPLLDDSCFGNLGLILEKTSKEEVAALLGEPFEIFLGGSGSWGYKVAGQHHREVYIAYRDNKVVKVFAPLVGCTLGDLIRSLGVPSTVGITVQSNQEPPICPSRAFYYPKLGATFFSPCRPDCSGGTVEECANFRSSDEIIYKIFHTATTSMESLLSLYRNVPSTFVQWEGFSKECQDDAPAP